LSAHGSFAASNVLLTFDDAFESFATHAWPELQGGNWPVTVFIVTRFVGRRSTWDLPLPGRRVAHLDWAALRDLAAAGVNFGSHGALHVDLRRCDDADLNAELEGSRRTLEDALGIPVQSFAYPFGRCDARVRRAAAASGYTLGFSVCPPGQPDRLAIRRHIVYVTDGGRAVLDKIDPRRVLHRFQDRFERGANACAAWAAR
jgi:peptidoglycan/xylan/chitin deacetylase (PgdA/CDA1 family)